MKKVIVRMRQSTSGGSSATNAYKKHSTSASGKSSDSKSNSTKKQFRRLFSRSSTTIDNSDPQRVEECITPCWSAGKTDNDTDSDSTHLFHTIFSSLSSHKSLVFPPWWFGMCSIMITITTTTTITITITDNFVSEITKSSNRKSFIESDWWTQKQTAAEQRSTNFEEVFDTTQQTLSSSSSCNSNSSDNHSCYSVHADDVDISVLPSRTECTNESDNDDTSSTNNSNNCDTTSEQTIAPVVFRNRGYEIWCQTRQAWKLAPPPQSPPQQRTKITIPNSFRLELIQCLYDRRQFELSQNIPLSVMIDCYTKVWENDENETAKKARARKQPPPTDIFTAKSNHRRNEWMLRCKTGSKLLTTNIFKRNYC